mmetsp:Transcript_30131/g.77726  ORF Transcript_30131/g.77726 Transcript_30131/m.77726 type:complete len:369 (+) Transcript_30131:299-1405(+)
MLAGFHVLLGVVPGASRIVQEERHHDTRGCGEHEERSQDLASQQRLPLILAEQSEGHPDGYRGQHREEPWLDHFSQPRLCHDGHASVVVRLLAVVHDSWPLPELFPHLNHHLLSSSSDGLHGPRRKQEHEHRSAQSTHKDLRHCNVHDFELFLGVDGDLIQEGREEQEARQRRGTDGEPLGVGLCDVAHGVQLIGDHPDMFRLLRHFHDTACVVSNGSEGGHGEHESGSGQHAHRCHSCAEQPRDALVLLRGDAGGTPEIVGGDQGAGDQDHGQARGLHPHSQPSDNVCGSAGHTCLSNALHLVVLVIGVVLRDDHKEVGTNNTHRAARCEPLPSIRSVGHIQEAPAQQRETSDGDNNGHQEAPFHDR